MVETYQSISRVSEALLKEKGSKFFAYAYPVQSIETIKELIETCKKEHHTARHWCYAYRIGEDGSEFRSNDDGEPNHSAGDPILRQIDSFELSNVLVIVVRYFGGVKLGVGGLIQAYGGAAQLALELAEVLLIEVKERIRISFEYPEMNEVMRVLKRYDAEMVSNEFLEKCWIIAETPRARFKEFEAELSQMHKLELKKL
jgi:uncharacterized YigZ family protein